MSDYFPDHLIANVFSRLPFDSLIRFRRVSKSWRALIDSPYLIKMHSERFYLIDQPYPHPGCKIIALNQTKFHAFDSVAVSGGRATPKELKGLVYPLEFLERGIDIVGSCNGLVCLWDFYQDDLVLWNPWIQKHHTLPPSPYECSRKCRGSLGAAFGYDHVNDDYKVVKWKTEAIPYCHFQNELPSSDRYELCVYSLKLKSWRRIRDAIPFELPKNQQFFPTDCAYANGALHWYVTDRPSVEFEKFIVTFDLATEEFRVICTAPLTANPPLHAFQEKLCTLNGCLCVICFYSSRKASSYIVDLWVMEDYGVESSWTTLISSIDVPICWGPWGSCLHPLAFSTKRRQLLLQIGWMKLVLYDVEKKSFRDLEIDGEASCFSSCVCVGSFVTPCT